MIYLFVFGDNIEDVFGHIGYLAFYLISGVAASLAQIAATLYAPALSSLLGLAAPSDLTIGVLGASGAISAVLGAYIVLFPKAYVLTFIIIVILPIPAILFLGFWFVLQWLMGFFNVAGGVAIFAHIGGFILGMILALTVGLNRKKKLKAKFQSKK
jgi:membrane associated rhomboid family serine protease